MAPGRGRRSCMSLIDIGLRNFRCFECVDVALSPGATIVAGANGAGKTSFLEAIFFLGRGRSFRTSRAISIQRQGADHFQVFASVVNGGRRTRLGAERRGGELRLRYDGKPARGPALLAEALPLILIDPHSHLLIEGGPAARRQFLDWGAFHVERLFLPDWRRFQRALKQRNALLKQRAAPRLLAGWDRELAEAGSAVDAWRHRFLERYLPVMNRVVPRLIPGVAVSLQYRHGWAAPLDLAEALAQARAQDQERGTTGVGPHRAELVIRWDGGVAQERVSRGQQKLLAAALSLAQAELYACVHGRSCLLLIDDPLAELDPVSLERLLSLLGGMRAQTVLTATEAERLPLFHLPERKLFHVEQGALSEMV